MFNALISIIPKRNSNILLTADIVFIWHTGLIYHMTSHHLSVVHSYSQFINSIIRFKKSACLTAYGLIIDAPRALVSRYKNDYIVI